MNLDLGNITFLDQSGFWSQHDSLAFRKRLGLDLFFLIDIA